MAKDKQNGGSGGQSRQYVPLVYARNLTEAEFIKGLLTSNDIPAIIEDEAGEVIGIPSSIVGQGVPILVPDEMLDEASEIIAEHDDTEEEAELEDDELDDELNEDLEDDEWDDDDLDDDEEYEDDELDDDEDLDDLDDDELDEDIEDIDEEDERA